MRDGVAACCESAEGRESAERTSAFGRCVRIVDVAVDVEAAPWDAVETTGVDSLERPTVPSDLPAASTRTAGIPAWFTNISECVGVGEFCASPCRRGSPPLMSGIETPTTPDNRTTMMISDPMEPVP